MFSSPILTSILLIFIYMNIGFLIGMKMKDNSIVDILWGLGFIVVIWGLEYFYDDHGLFLKYLVTFWGLRLSYYLLKRFKKKGEDWRYAAWKKQWAHNYVLISYFRVYMLQGFFMFIICLPFMFFDNQPPHLNTIQVIAIILFVIGLSIESLADYQLSVFKSNRENKGRIMTTGIWKYSRHPNYFGEMLVWWAIFMYVLPYTSWISILSPITITILLTKVSGVPFLEKKYKEDKAYQEYVKRTSIFIPLPPKKK